VVARFVLTLSGDSVKGAEDVIIPVADTTDEPDAISNTAPAQRRDSQRQGYHADPVAVLFGQVVEPLAERVAVSVAEAGVAFPIRHEAAREKITG
jgi:hypothetical protein